MYPRGRSNSCGKLLLLFLVGILIGLAGATASLADRNKSDDNATVTIEEHRRDEYNGFASQMRVAADMVDRAVHRAATYVDDRSAVYENSEQGKPQEIPEDSKSVDSSSISSSENSEQGKPWEIPEDSKRVDSTSISSSGNSDQENLKDSTGDRKLLTGYEVAHFKNELEKLRDRIDMPSRANMMQRAITDAKNISNAFEERSWALYKLLFLLEDGSDAYYFLEFGGLAVIIEALKSPQAELRAISAWILAKASQIIFPIKNLIRELDPLPLLLKMVKSSILDESVKALCAVSAILEDDMDTQDKFFSENNGAVVLQEIMSNSSAHIRLRRKSSFIADLAVFHLENHMHDSPFTSQSFYKSLVDLIRSSDFYLQWKGLLTIKKMHSLLSPDEADSLLKDCDLYDALELMRKELDDLVGERNVLGNTFIELETLHRHVWELFPEHFKRITSEEQKRRHERAKYPRPNPVEMD